MNIRPKNYEEVLRLKSCLEMKGYVPSIDDELLEQMFHFLGAGMSNRVRASGDILSFTGPGGEVVYSKAIPELPKLFTAVELRDFGCRLSITRAYSGSGGDSGGASGNNNNNNNNNNNG